MVRRRLVVRYEVSSEPCTTSRRRDLACRYWFNTGWDHGVIPIRRTISSMARRSLPSAALPQIMRSITPPARVAISHSSTSAKSKRRVYETWPLPSSLIVTAAIFDLSKIKAPGV
jgi:hypothetical protein